MAWPSDQDYNEAVQNPKAAFDDLDLRSGQVEASPIGIPKARSGNFAAVYKVFSNGTAYAVKCFRYDNPEYGRRYPAIASHLSQNRLPYFVTFLYMLHGIRVGAHWYPVLKMKWTEGESLIGYIEKNLHSPIVLKQLASSWARLLIDLQQAKIAHGDLQHGNVLVVGNDLKLVDYDGMYVPGLNGGRGLEIGHRNYQHPERTELDFGEYLDNFSGWLIYTSILALSARPSLWNELNSGDECLLFRKHDLTAPETSEAFRLLKAVRDTKTRDLTDRIETFLWLPLSRIPAMTEAVLEQPAIQSAPPFANAADWIRDHLPETPLPQRPSELRDTEDNEIGDPSWIQDHVSLPETVGAFQNSVLTDRIFILISYFVAAALSVLRSPENAFGAAVVYATALLVATASVLLFLWIQYLQEPIHSASRAATIDLRTATLNAEVQSSAREAIKAKRRLLKDEYSANIVGLSQKTSVGQAEKAKEMSIIEADLNGTLQQLLDKRRSLANEEVNEKKLLFALSTTLSEQINDLLRRQKNDLGRLDSGLGQTIRDLEAQFQQIVSKKDTELRRALSEYQDQIVLGHLHRHRIAGAGISGIGEELTRRLAHAGFISAADIVSRPVGVSGIGAKKLSSLSLWAGRLENNIRSNHTPKLLPSHKTADIEQRYEGPSRQLEQILTVERAKFATANGKIQTQYAGELRTIEARKGVQDIHVSFEAPRIEARFEALRSSLATDEQQARARAEKLTQDCTLKLDILLSEVATDAERFRDVYAGGLEGMSMDLVETAKRVRQARWHQEQLSRHRKRFAKFSFTRYCFRAFGRA